MDMGVMLEGLAPGVQDWGIPISAPRCRGSAAMVESVSAAVRIGIA